MRRKLCPKVIFYFYFHTKLVLISAEAEPPYLLQPGDRVLHPALVKFLVALAAAKEALCFVGSAIWRQLDECVSSSCRPA